MPLNQILHDLYDSAGYDLFIDYRRPPAPSLNEQDADWVARLLADYDSESGIDRIRFRQHGMDKFV